MSTVKPLWADGVGYSYETKFLYTGRGRINTHTKMYETFQNGLHLFLFERPFPGGVVSRVYASELATVTEYSKLPRKWKEETPTSTQYFTEVRRIS